MSTLMNHKRPVSMSLALLKGKPGLEDAARFKCEGCQHDEPVLVRMGIERAKVDLCPDCADGWAAMLAKYAEDARPKPKPAASLGELVAKIGRVPE